MKTLSKFIIISGAVSLIILMILNLRQCNPEPPVIITRIDTVTNVIYKDSLKIDTIIYSNVKIVNDTIYLNDTILQLDTIFLYVNDYLAAISIIDTIKNDISAKIIIKDTLQRNRIKNRLAVIEVYNKTEIIPENPLYLTAGAFYLQNSIFNSMGGKIGLNTLKNNLSIGFGTHKTILLTYDRKFKLKN